MSTSTNRLSELYGIDATDPNALRKAAASSPIGGVQQSLGRLGSDPNYTTVYETGFSLGTIPAGLTLTEEGTTTAAGTYNGQATITTDDVAAKSDQLNTPLSWRCDKQTDKPLIAQVRWKAGTLAANEYWIGFTDAAADTDPIALSATSTFTTSVPTDGVYMGYSATPTSGAAFTTGGNQHTCLAIKADANTLVGTGGGAFVTAVFYTYRIELDANGTARYYVNDQLLFTQAAAITVTAPLALMICATPRTTASAALTVDNVFVAGAGTL